MTDRCWVPGCTLRGSHLAEVNTTRKVHRYGTGDYFTLCQFQREVAPHGTYNCVRSDGHEGEHVFLQGNERLMSVYGPECRPVRTNIGLMCDVHLNDGSMWLDGKCAFMSLSQEVKVTHDGRNKPAFQHIIDKRRKE